MSGSTESGAEDEIRTEAFNVVKYFRASLGLNAEEMRIANSMCATVLKVAAGFIAEGHDQGRDTVNVVAGVKAGIAMALKALQDSRIVKP